ncbi:SDR family oxidoreductase [Paracoccaceae bacterium GXU_MW_L88]
MTGAALVTGGAKRIGAALVRALAARGKPVAIHYNSSGDAAEALAREITEAGGKAVALQGDLLDPQPDLIARAAEALGPLDLLVNNASIFEYDRIGTVTPESWDRHLGSNLRAPLMLTQDFAAQAGAGSNIINIIDQRVRKLTPEFMTYTLAKSALWTLTQTAAQGLAPKIRVNAIGPGPTLQGARQSKDHFDQQQAATILGIGSDPEGIVRAMEFLIDSPSVTGQLICVDGGQHLAWKTPDILGVE